jgi:hypothetical protein
VRRGRAFFGHLRGPPSRRTLVELAPRPQPLLRVGELRRVGGRRRRHRRPLPLHLLVRMMIRTAEHTSVKVGSYQPSTLRNSLISHRLRHRALVEALGQRSRTELAVARCLLLAPPRRLTPAGGWSTIAPARTLPPSAPNGKGVGEKALEKRRWAGAGRRCISPLTRAAPSSPRAEPRRPGEKGAGWCTGSADRTWAPPSARRCGAGLASP